MNVDEDQKDKELATRSWRNDVLQYNPQINSIQRFFEPLTEHNALNYFCQVGNPFYDKTSNNEVIKMQRLDPSAMKYNISIMFMVDLYVQ